MGTRFATGFVVVVALLLLGSSALVGASGLRAAGGGAAGTFAGSTAVAPVASALPLPGIVPPVETPTAIPVGGGPDAVLVDPVNNTVFVANRLSSDVTQISLPTNTVVATIPVGSQPAPQAMALDIANATIYVVTSGSNNVSAISIPDQFVTATIPVGASPDAIAFNPSNKDVYVANGGTGSVTIISSVTNLVLATIPVGFDPDAVTVDSVNHEVFVADAGSNNVTAISGSTNLVLNTTTVGTGPGPFGAMGFDPIHNEVFVANVGSNNVSVIGGTNHTLLATIAVGSGPSGLVVDPAKGEVFVANQYSNNVSVISTSLDEVIATIPVGDQPSLNGAIAINTVLGTVYVPNSGSSNVSVISVATDAVLTSVPVLNVPDAVAVDSTNGAVYVADEGSGNVSTFAFTSVTFRASGLPVHSTWSLSVGSPPLLVTNTTVRTSGTIELLEETGNLSYTILPPSGYGVASVTGLRSPTQSVANLTSVPTTLVIKFGPIEMLTFVETGLPAGTPWGIAISPSLAHGGPPSQHTNTTGSSVNFSVVRGSWKFQVTSKPSLYAATPSHGAVGVAKPVVTKDIKFKPLTATVVFREVGLRGGTLWQVNITGPINMSRSSTAATLKFLLVNGTYTFSAWNFSALHPHPASGSFTVVVPHAAVTVTVEYTASLVRGGAGPTVGSERTDASAAGSSRTETVGLVRPDE
ncbi:MAG: YncE family protein [Thermoplasmata archaeon]